MSGEFPPMRGGMADYTSLLATALARYGVSSTVVTSAKAVARPSSANSGFAGDAPDGPGWVRVYGTRNWGYSSWRRVLEVIEGARPDVLHIQYQTGAFDLHPAINLLPARLRLLPSRPKVIVTFHDLRVPYLFPKAGPIRRLATVALVLGADSVVVTNAEDAWELRARAARGSPERVRFGGHPFYRIPIGSNIPPRPPAGFDRAAWRDRLGVGPEQVLMSYFGFLGSSKGVDLLMEALGALLGRGCNVKLLMVGGSTGDSNPADRAYERQMRMLADGPTYRGRVLWTGFTGPEDVSANLLASDVCVLPFHEGASFRHGTLVAAIVHGVPIVTTTRRSLPPLEEGLELRSMENCLLVPPGDVAALARAIEQLSVAPELRLRLAAGAAALGAHFEWDSIAQKTLRTYQHLLNAKTRV